MKKLNQDGIVSIIVTSVIITIMTLIVLSFSTIMRRESQQSLDRQLNTQAFYAAETAVNDVRAGIYNGTITSNIDTCGVFASGRVNSASANASEIGCVTVDLNPETLTFDSISTDRSKIVVVNAIDGAGNPTDLSSIRIEFEDPQSHQDFNGGGTYPPDALLGAAGTGLGPGLLRVEIIAVPNGSFDRDTLRANNRVFLVNTNSNAAVPVTYGWGTVANSIRQVPQGCDPTDAGLSRDCGFIVNSLPVGIDRFVVRLTSVYEPVSVTITAITIAGGTASFTNSQAIVDATGRSNDATYRTREVIPINLTYDYAEFGVQAGDICKLLESEPGSTTVAGNKDASIPACSL